MSNKTLQERLEEARNASPVNELTPHQAALRVSNSLKKGISTGKVTKGAFKEGQEAWNKGKEIGKDTWGKTRKERAKEMSEEERRAYFGTVEQHTEKTKEQMSESASARWAKQMRRVMADGIEYANIYEASSALGVHKDTIVYRINAKGANWHQWYFIENDE
jgi:DNA-directed RNA polymerase